MASEIYAINSDPLAASPSRFNHAAKSYRRVRSSFQDELNFLAMKYVFIVSYGFCKVH